MNYEQKYVKNMYVAGEIGKGILDKYSLVPNKTVIFDFDETLCDSKTFDKDYMCKQITPIVELAKYAKQLGYSLYIITARPEYMKEKTYENAKLFGIIPDNVFTIINNIKFKSIMRRNLQCIDKNTANSISPLELYNINSCKIKSSNLNIVLTIGDQQQDVEESYGYYAIKLPYYHKDDVVLFYDNIELCKK